MGTAAAVSLSEVELRASFDAFVRASQRLESGYRELKTHAAAVDLQLRATNARLEAALSERQAIVAALPIGLVAVREGGNHTCYNHEAERLCQLGRAAGHDLTLAAPGDVELDGAVVRVRVVDLADGRLVLLEDRTQVMRLEREVHRLDRLAGLSELALGVAHEIKNPLNGVMGFASMLQRQSGDATVQRFAGKIVQGLRQVDDIVKGMLSFARPQRTRGSLATVGAIVAEAAAAAGLPQHRVHLDGEPALRGESEALVRVLANLFRNSCEAGGEDTMVHVHAAADADKLVLVVRDDGPGIPRELGHRVLEPFVSSKERGSGLGLALAVRVLTFLGGDLELLNAGEPGACFRVRAPLGKTAQEAPA